LPSQARDKHSTKASKVIALCTDYFTTVLFRRLFGDTVLATTATPSAAGPPGATKQKQSKALVSHRSSLYKHDQLPRQAPGHNTSNGLMNMEHTSIHL
jgi:hypothetical protein